jgi:flagellar biosynthesis/type III secretory pathway chaperone
MPTPEKILIEMEKVVDQVIQTAEQLKDISRRVISEEELAPLLKSQDKLVSQLKEMDEAFQKVYKGGKVSPIRERIEKKLERFQELNSKFIENLSSSQGIIQFENGKAKKNKT